MRWRAMALAGVLAAASPAPAGAQSAGAEPGTIPPAPPSDAKPAILHLSATGTVQAPQDLLVAALVAQATAATPAAAQRQVNQRMAAGMQQAAAAPGLEARAAGYTVTPTEDEPGAPGRRPPQWAAQQTLELRGQNGPALLDLAGRLQAQGFATASLDWQLSEAARRTAQQAATMDALKQVMARAAAAASALGLHIGRYRDVRLEDGGPSVMAPRMMMASMARSASPPPQASAGPEEVTATASVDVELLP